MVESQLMGIKKMIEAESVQKGSLSRSDIESLCILSAISGHGSSTAELPTRLGLSPSLVAVVVEAIGPLIATGHIELGNDRITVTTAGTDWLNARLPASSDRIRR